MVAAASPAGLACTPEIGTGAYFCGPERSCPPDQACDEPTFTCVTPLSAESFRCPDGSETFEPDDELGDARDLGALVCGQALFGGGTNGCIASVGQIDTYAFSGNDCPGARAARVGLTLRFPTAFAPLELVLLDSNGTVVGAGLSCGAGQDFGGLDAVCLEMPVDNAAYFVRVSLASDGPTCDGGCAFASYLLDIASLL
jgi:hypothetical protein